MKYLRYDWELLENTQNLRSVFGGWGCDNSNPEGVMNAEEELDMI